MCVLLMMIYMATFYNIQRDEKKDWRRREKILRETIDGVKVLLFILSSTTDDDVIRFR